jgi:hypothetical protein
LFGGPARGASNRHRKYKRLREAITSVRHLRGRRLLSQANGHRVKAATLQSWMKTACRRARLPTSRNLHRLRHLLLVLGDEERAREGHPGARPGTPS